MPSPGPISKDTSMSDFKDKGFLVVDNVSEQDNTWSLVLTDDEERSTSSSDEADNVENLLSDSSDDDDGAVAAAASSASSLGEKCAPGTPSPSTSFRLPSISRARAGVKAKSPLTKSWVGAVVAALLFVAYYAGSVTNSSGVVYVVPPSSRKIYTTVVLEKTTTLTVKVPKETVTVDRYMFPIPQTVKDYYAAEKEHAQDVIGLLYENHIKSSPVMVWSDEKLNELKNNEKFLKAVEVSGTVAGTVKKSFDEKVLSHFSEENKEKLVGISKAVAASVQSTFGKANEKVLSSYEKVSPVAKKYYSDAFETVVNYGSVSKDAALRNGKMWQQAVASYDYKMLFSSAKKEASKSVFDASKAAKTLFDSTVEAGLKSKEKLSKFDKSVLSDIPAKTMQSVKSLKVQLFSSDAKPKQLSENIPDWKSVSQYIQAKLFGKTIDKNDADSMVKILKDKASRLIFQSKVSTEKASFASAKIFKNIFGIN